MKYFVFRDKGPISLVHMADSKCRKMCYHHKSNRTHKLHNILLWPTSHSYIHCCSYAALDNVVTQKLHMTDHITLKMQKCQAFKHWYLRQFWRFLKLLPSKLNAQITYDIIEFVLLPKNVLGLTTSLIPKNLAFGKW